MCGIVGYAPLPEVRDNAFVIKAFNRLFTESCIRGLHAYGLSDVYDSAVGVLDTFRTYDQSEIGKRFDPNANTIAHARYCQSGDWRTIENNQPIVVGQMAFAMNGVISMGTKEEYETEFGVTCAVDNDSEVFLRKIEDAKTPEEVMLKAANFIGSINGSLAGTFLAFGYLFAARNDRRPLWRCDAYGARWYASTYDIFHRAGFSGQEPVTVGVEMSV